MLYLLVDLYFVAGVGGAVALGRKTALAPVLIAGWCTGYSLGLAARRKKAWASITAFSFQRDGNHPISDG